MDIIQKFMTANDCYQDGKRIEVKGLMVHSTATPGIMAADWFSRWNKPSLSPGKCVHAFLDDNVCYQYLPWHWRGWHAGGSANNTHIGIEWCEPKDLYDKDYLAKIWDNGVELYAMLCKQYGLTEKNIIAHYEGYKLGVASNHGDPAHWWKLHGKTMDMFRDDVAKALKGQYKEAVQVSGTSFFNTGGYAGDELKTIHTFLVSNGFGFVPFRQEGTGNMIFDIGGFPCGSEAEKKMENFLNKKRFAYQKRIG